MWLLSTDRAELHYFSRTFDADGGYAILSHTWEKNEQTYQEVRAISERCRRHHANPRDDPELSPKIREMCILAEEHGYQWAWVDSCCIDKTSSSELSEAVNSMYRWYSDCEVCYAYLADVPGDCILDASNSAFRRSRWHTRGWTLQELVAPARLLFISSDWTELGNRTTLANLLQEITGIESRIFTRQKRPADFSIASRMNWASRRRTTRVEDEAYCLMGLFDVSMPANYGEGERAFTRLQYEIMRHNSDTSLFVFGDDFLPRGDFSTHGITLGLHVDICDTWQFLLASSPREFETRVHYTPRSLNPLNLAGQRRRVGRS
ncbi:hypothetical protein DICSQDRAFT_175037 [Dichomitus squalens LYAD-421 SS1]|uniref:Uncharacterized protein n=1 Tax=Dichomitus squalens (strain LYAD-421) TaxID=732165 RepID=R7SKN9_DICSQ|nr:uncharacterized protein DICSQDRAFT_175037 [Dichomitus squalens LYAD-421 SS1]EJF56300.1 hypothetical protein DICSQDRAFT_175037 [Dichomitus squalens LYAD-421 SS1]